MKLRFPLLPSRDSSFFVISLLACLTAAAVAQDTDGDGIPDAWETTWHLNPNDPGDAGVDFDLDGLTSLQEYQLSLQGKGEGPIGVWTAQIVPISPTLTDIGSDLNVVGLNDNDDILINSPASSKVRRASDGAWGALTLNLPNSYVYGYDLVGLNDNCDVVGNVSADTGFFGFKKNPFSGSGPTDVQPFYLPGETTAPVASFSGINNSGDLIGTRQNGTPFFHKAASGLVTAPSAWTGVVYSGLNNQGQASGSRHDPMGSGAPAHFVLSGTSSWTAPYPASLLVGFDPSEIDPPDMVLDAVYKPRFLNDRGEFAGTYGWRVGSPEDEEKIYTGGICYFDGTGYENLLPQSGFYAYNHKIHGLNNHSQTLVSATDETGESVQCYLQRKGVTVPISAISPIPELATYTYGFGVPTRINNKSTIAGITGSSNAGVPGVTVPSIYFLRPAAEQDMDGMPNDWELYHGLSPLNPADAELDADSDGLSNLREFQLGTDPNKKHSDNDGVPDGIEVLDNSTDPLSSTDADSDGLPDDFEKDLAKQLLAINPSISAWGPGLYPGLVAGNLDPNHDYTGDGLSTLQLFNTIIGMPLGEVVDYLIETQRRSNVISGTYDPASGSTPAVAHSSYGYLYQSNFETPDDWHHTDLGDNVTNMYPAYLSDRIDAVAWVPDHGGANPFLTIENGYTDSIADFHLDQWNPAHWYYSGIMSHRRFRLQTTRIDHPGLSVMMLRLFSRSGANDTFPFVSGSAEKVILPRGKIMTDWVESKVQIENEKSTQEYLVDVDIELFPLLKDEDGNDIWSSMYPNADGALTPLVESDPVVNKIAHRELKVSLSSILKGKKVVWTLEPVPGAIPATIRGEWSDSPSHKDRFEASATYGSHEFRKISQLSGETVVGETGYTAIRVNVPPIGLNKVRIKLHIEGFAEAFDLIDMEVPAVVVIDPGHGGTADVPGSHWNNASSPSGVLEKKMTLDYGLAVRDSLEKKIKDEKLNIRLLMTRETDVNVEGSARAYVARDNGADIIFIIHFNADDETEDNDGHPRTPHRSRGTLQVTQHNNANAAEDAATSNTIISRMVTALQGYDSACNQRPAVATPTDVAADNYLGNTSGYHPIRAPYCEVEFIDYGANTTTQSDDSVDILMNTGTNAAAVKSAVADAVRDGIIHDLRTHTD